MGCLCVCVFVCLCLCLCVFVCLCVYLCDLCLFVCFCVYVFVFLRVCVFVCLYCSLFIDYCLLLTVIVHCTLCIVPYGPELMVCLVSESVYILIVHGVNVVNCIGVSRCLWCQWCSRCIWCHTTLFLLLYYWLFILLFIYVIDYLYYHYLNYLYYWLFILNMVSAKKMILSSSVKSLSDVIITLSSGTKFFCFKIKVSGFQGFLLVFDK